jgi:hypothetical protein
MKLTPEDREFVIQQLTAALVASYRKEVERGSIDNEEFKQVSPISTTNKKAAPGIFARRPRAARKERGNGKYT